jgi:hypothetical protein
MLGLLLLLQDVTVTIPVADAAALAEKAARWDGVKSARAMDGALEVTLRPGGRLSTFRLGKIDRERLRLSGRVVLGLECDDPDGVERKLAGLAKSAVVRTFGGEFG